jgi:hypothetical protein
MDINNAFYIKLGKGGEYVESCFNQNLMRFGWFEQSLADINDRKWEKIHKQLFKSYNNKGVAARDLAALRSITESTSGDLWITFHQSRMWWCQLDDGPVLQDDESQYRCVKDGWSDLDLKGNRLLITELPGKIAMIQRFAGVSCKVKHKDILIRLINNQPNVIHRDISEARETLIQKAVAGIRDLHPKDFEVLVDLIFRNTGWRRLSVLGENMKDIDLLVQEPITREYYQIQVKSSAGKSDYDTCVDNFSSDLCRKMYFIVHTSHPDLRNVKKDPRVEIFTVDEIAAKVVDLGLTCWLLQKVR